MLEFIRNITSRRNEDGASAVEYGLLVAGIAALIVAIVFVFGGVIKSAFEHTCKTIKGSGTAASATCCLTDVGVDPERPHGSLRVPCSPGTADASARGRPADLSRADHGVQEDGGSSVGTH